MYLITKIALISSFGCNLNCKYCILDKKKDAGELQKETIQALQNGDFLKTIKTSLTRLSIPPDQITQLEFCGQESTLTLKYITKILPDIFNYLPNINNITLSTNGTGDPKDIIEFITAINTYHKQNLNLLIQWFYDGMDKYRGISAVVIMRNIKTVLRQVSTINFNNMTVQMQARRIVSKELLKDLFKDNSIDEYYNNLYYFDKSFNYDNLNIEANFCPILEFEMPIGASKDDGENLAKFMQYDKIPYSEKLLELIRQYKCTSFDNFCHLFLDNINLASEIIQQLNDNFYCGVNYDELIIRYDGTLASCRNMIFDTVEKFTEIEKSWQKNNLNFNIYDSSNEQINNIIQIFTYNRTAWNFIIEHMMIIMKTMVNAGYIKDIYNNEFDYFKYAFLGLTFSQCYYANLIETGSIYLQGKGFFNFFYNGYIELVEQQYDRMLQQ